MAKLGGAKPFATEATGGGGAGSDTTAIHDNVSAEISAVTEKASPVNADLVLIEDSAASNAKKRVQLGNLPGATNKPASGEAYPEDFAAVTETSLAPGDALTTDGPASGTWKYQLAFSQVATLDATKQPPGVSRGSIKANVAVNVPETTTEQWMGVEFSSGQAGAGEILAVSFMYEAATGNNHHRDQLEVVWSSSAQTTSADLVDIDGRKDIDIGTQNSFGKWQNIKFIMDDEASTTVRFIGIRQKYGLQKRAGIATNERGVIYLADVRFMNQTEADNAALNATTNQVYVPSNFSPTGTENTPTVLTGPNSTRTMIDGRPTVRVISDFNGIQTTSQFYIDNTGATAVDEALQEVLSNIGSNAVLEFSPGKYMLDNAESLGIHGHSNLTIRGNGARLFHTAHQNLPIVELSENDHIYIRDLNVFGFKEDTQESVISPLTDATESAGGSGVLFTSASGDHVNDGVRAGHYIINTTDGSWAQVTSVTATLIACSGGLANGTDDTFDIGDVIAITAFKPTNAATTPTISGDDIILNEQDEEILTDEWTVARQEDWEYEFKAILSDSAQVADDLQWEIRSRNRELTANTAKGPSNVTLTDTTVDSYDGGTLTITFSTGDMVNDGVVAGMRVFNDTDGAVGPGLISSVTATTIVLGAAVGTWDAADVVRIGFRDPDDRPMPKITLPNRQAREGFQSDEVEVGDIIVNTTDGNSWAIVGEVREDEIRIDEKDTWKDGTTDEITAGDTFEIYRIFGTGTQTLTATPTEYTFTARPDDQKIDVQLSLKKRTATANTITVEEYTVRNAVRRARHGQAQTSLFSASFEFEHGFGFKFKNADVTFEHCSVEGGIGGDGWGSTIDQTKRIKLLNCSSLGALRQGTSFNFGEDILIDGGIYGKCGRSVFDVEPAAPNNFMNRITIRNLVMLDPTLFGMACANDTLIYNMNLENLEFQPGRSSSGFITGGANGGRWTNITDYSGLGTNIAGTDIWVDGFTSNGFNFTGTRTTAKNLHIVHQVDQLANVASIVIGAAATDIDIDGVYMNREALTQDDANNGWWPISNLSSDTNIRIRNVHMGYALKTYTSTYKGVAAQDKPDNTPWYPDGMNMYSEPHLNVGQQSIDTVAGPNIGEYNVAPTAASGTFNLVFPSKASGAVQPLTSSSTAINHADGALGAGTYDYAIRHVPGRGGPGGTATTDANIVVAGGAGTDSVLFIISNSLASTTLLRGICLYRKLDASARYTHRYIWRQYGTEGRSALEGLMSFADDVGMSFYDLGTVLRINRETQFTPVDVAVETGDVTLTANTYDGGGSATVFEDADADFLNDGVKIGYQITNDTTAEVEEITGVTKTTITHAALSSGNWAGSDTCTITKMWDADEDETGWEPDLNYSVFTTPSWANASTPIAEKRHDGINYTWGTNPAAGDVFDYEIKRLENGA